MITVGDLEPCFKTLGGRVKRHDTISRSVAGWLIQKGHEVRREVTVPFAGTVHRYRTAVGGRLLILYTTALFSFIVFLQNSVALRYTM